uniref:Uncharacterized protein n=1 Tax=Nelumbo nucifera TaxID=4432 RepID=A0A822YUV9_NELNU|nr:TPA_asm: hypothetical protein HUJ06_006940 [Nelumbo nucifera]
MAAKLATVASIVILSVFVVLGHARDQFTLPEKVVTEWKPSDSFPDTDAKSTIVLPSEKPVSEAEEALPVENRASESDVGTVEDLPESIEAIGITQPLTLTYDISFRPPINRRFHHMHVKRPFGFRFPHRCRHHHAKPLGDPRFTGKEIPHGNDMIMAEDMPSFDHYAKLLRGPRFTGKEIPYGNDMLMAEDMPSFDPMFSGDARHIPGKWGGFPRERRFWKKPSDDWKHGDDGRRFHHHPMGDEEDEDSFMNRFLKFLNHF